MRPGRAVEAGRDGPWLVAGRPRLQLLAPEEAGGGTGPPTDAEAARAKLKTWARAARRQRKLKRETATSLRWALFLWASAGFAWVVLVTLAYKVARDYLPFALALAAAMALLPGGAGGLLHPRLRLRAPSHNVPGHHRAMSPTTARTRRPTTWTRSRGPSTSSRSTTGSPSKATSATSSSTRK